MDLNLRGKVVSALVNAGLSSFIGPLTKPGFVIIEEGSGVHNLDFIEQEFRKPARKGVVVYPCLYNDLESMKNAGEGYVRALFHQGICSELLVYDDLIYTVFVFVPEDQESVKINAATMQMAV